MKDVFKITILFSAVTLTVQWDDERVLRQLKYLDKVLHQENRHRLHNKGAIPPEDDYPAGNMEIGNMIHELKSYYNSNLEGSPTKAEEEKHQLFVENLLESLHKFGCESPHELIDKPSCKRDFCRYHLTNSIGKDPHQDNFLGLLCTVPVDENMLHFFLQQIHPFRDLTKKKPRKLYYKNKWDQRDGHRDVDDLSVKDTWGKAPDSGSHVADNLLTKIKERIRNKITDAVRKIVDDIHKEYVNENLSPSNRECMLEINNKNRIKPHQENSNNVYVPMKLYNKIFNAKKTKLPNNRKDLHDNILDRSDLGFPYKLQIEGLGQAVP